MSSFPSSQQSRLGGGGAGAGGGGGGRYVEIPCCLCGSMIQPNGANQCAACLGRQYDLSGRLQSGGLYGSPYPAVYQCRQCKRYRSTPKHYVRAEPESPELLALCLKHIPALNNHHSGGGGGGDGGGGGGEGDDDGGATRQNDQQQYLKFHLVDAAFIWTEPHSRRLKVRVTVRTEICDVPVQQRVAVTLRVDYRQCGECGKEFTNRTWTAVVQVRQKRTNHGLVAAADASKSSSGRPRHYGPSSKHRGLLALEMALARNKSIRRDVLQVDALKYGFDFYFADLTRAQNFVNCLRRVGPPMRYKTSSKLVSTDVKNNTAHVKHTVSCDLVPLVRDDLLLVHKKCRHAKLSGRLALVTSKPTAARTTATAATTIPSGASNDGVVNKKKKVPSSSSSETSSSVLYLVDVSPTKRKTALSKSEAANQRAKADRRKKRKNRRRGRGRKNHLSSSGSDDDDDRENDHDNDTNDGDGDVASAVSNDNVNVNVNNAMTEHVMELTPDAYYRNEKLYTVLQASHHLMPFVVLDVEPWDDDNKKDGGGNDRDEEEDETTTIAKYGMADAVVARQSDLGVNDRTIRCVTHLGPLLSPGDVALGYDLTSSSTVVGVAPSSASDPVSGGGGERNGGSDDGDEGDNHAVTINGRDRDEVLNSGYVLPEIVLVKKVKGGEGTAAAGHPAEGAETTASRIAAGKENAGAGNSGNDDDDHEEENVGGRRKNNKKKRMTKKKQRRKLRNEGKKAKEIRDSAARMGFLDDLQEGEEDHDEEEEEEGDDEYRDLRRGTNAAAAANSTNAGTTANDHDDGNAREREFLNDPELAAEVKALEDEFAAMETSDGEGEQEQQQQQKGEGEKYDDDDDDDER